MSPSSYLKYAEVLLDLALDKPLDYGIPEALLFKVARGSRVEIPVNGHPRLGTVIALKESSSFPKVQPLLRVINDQAPITPELFELALWMSQHYCAPLRQVLKVVLPAAVRKEIKPKQQLYVMRAKTKEELANYCIVIREKAPAQGAVLDAMLQVTKGILLTELLELTQGTRAPVDSLVKKGFLLIDIVRVDRSPLVNEEYFKTKPKMLNLDQTQALQALENSLTKTQFCTHLLYGITGSGKTEVYLQAIDCALKQGKGTIMLVPEISLTAQTIARFRSRFEGKIAVLHHRLSPGERLDEWERIRRGEASIVIGARSAVFSPVVNLGLLIVDEEHEPSYKQTEEAPCYHARDVAVMRGKMHQATVILGSATPALESFHNAQTGKYHLSTLGVRADAASLPRFTIVDMRREFERAKGFTSFSEVLIDGIKKRQALGEQTILFLNRRGYHTTLLCQACQTAIKCKHCDVTLTFHKGDNTLACHLCNYTLAPPPISCPSCKAPHPLKFKGVGTEQIERALHAILPDIRTVRMDADTTRHKGSHQRLLRDFGSGKADVLIGTQMIAKGLHFPEVTLVGVLASDASLQIPDFRAAENTFQLITQVAGRAGRGSISGEVIVQTSLPDHPTIRLAAAQSYAAFFEQEMVIRKLYNYPPYTQLIKVTLSGEQARQTLEYGHQLQRHLQTILPSTCELHPIVAAGHAKVKDLFRYQFLLRGPSIAPMNRALQETCQAFPPPRTLRLLIDVAPLSTF